MFSRKSPEIILLCLEEWGPIICYSLSIRVGSAAEILLPQPIGMFCLLLLFLLDFLQRGPAPFIVSTGLGQLRMWPCKNLGNTTLFPEKWDGNEWCFFAEAPVLCVVVDFLHSLSSQKSGHQSRVMNIQSDSHLRWTLCINF